jgi:cysteine desulfurase/selenocysteine lyase
MRDGIDFLAAASHKFLLGTRGMGYFYVRKDLLHHMRPVGPGWKAAREPSESFFGPAMDLSRTASKLDASLAWFPALADQAALSVFKQFGAGRLLERNANLGLHLQNALTMHGVPVPGFSGQNRFTIVSVEVADTESVLTRFQQENIVASVRAGRIRLSVHFYNSEEELDHVAELIGQSGKNRLT